MARELASAGRITIFRHGKGENHWVRHCEGRDLSWFRVRHEPKRCLIVFIGRFAYHLRLRRKEA